jgi:folate-dependent phosphoribosylglycinamide formyltransferase PurN
MKLKYQCVRHKKYDTKKEAESAMIKAIHKYKINLSGVYLCKWCYGWHMTKNNQLQKA